MREVIFSKGSFPYFVKGDNRPQYLDLRSVKSNPLSVLLEP